MEKRLEKFEEYVSKLLELARSLQQKSTQNNIAGINPSSDSMNSNNTSPSDGTQTNKQGTALAKSNFSNTVETISRKNQMVQSLEKENRQRNGSVQHNPTDMESSVNSEKDELNNLRKGL